jgi:hypothetical protein
VLRKVLAAAALATAVLPVASASAVPCPPGFEERKFSLTGSDTWIACLPE